MPELWMVNQYAITPDLPGGTRHYDLAKELVKRGFQVKVFASDVNLSLRQHTKLARNELFKVEELGGVQFVWVRANQYSSNDWRRASNMLSFARNLNRVAAAIGASSTPNIVIGSSPTLFAAWAAQRVARRFHAHYVLELRDLWPQALVDMGGLSERHPGVVLMRGLERMLYARAERIIVLAQGSVEYLSKRRVAPASILFIPNGVHLGHFQSSGPRSDLRERLGFCKFTVVYTGAHGPANHLETIVRTAKIVEGESVEFVLVGDGPAKVELLQLADELAVSNIRFLPPVPKQEIPDILLAADAGVITLRNARAFAYGISPNKLFDYMAAALPVLCSVPGEMAAMVRQAEAGLTSSPEDPAALADKVRQLLAMSVAEREHMAQNGFRYLERHYQREKLADDLAMHLWRITDGS